MQGVLGSRRRRLAVLVIAGLSVAGGVAYATIPDSGAAYTACMLKNVGTIRLIDPSLRASNLMSHCTSLETQISWNMTGQPGQAGPKGDPGAAGKDGLNGTSVSSVSLNSGDPNCPNSGSQFTAGGGNITYACSGAPGPAGPKGDPGDFSGHFQSPNGLYSIDVTNSGIRFQGPSERFTMGATSQSLEDSLGNKIAMDTGGITIRSSLGLNLRASDVGIDGDATVSIDGSAQTSLSGGVISVDGLAETSVSGGVITLNGCTTPLVLMTDAWIGTSAPGFAQVNDVGPGSPTICVG